MSRSTSPSSRPTHTGPRRSKSGARAAISSRRVGQVTSVIVGAPRQVRWHGRTVTIAIWKYPVGGRVPAVGVNIDGDDQADRRVHGGPTKAIYAYAVEDYQWWAEQLSSRY
jgi:MOSC domain-containing protein YiiM